MKNWFSRSEQRRWLVLVLLLAGAGLGFLGPWHALAPLLIATLLLFLPAASGKDELNELNALLKKVKDGWLGSRLPRSSPDPVLDGIRININSTLDQTETAFREMLGAMEASTSGRTWRRLQTAGLHGAFEDVLKQMQGMLDRLEAAQESVAREALLSHIFLSSEGGLTMAIDRVNQALAGVSGSSAQAESLAHSFYDSATASGSAESMSSASVRHRSPREKRRILIAANARTEAIKDHQPHRRTATNQSAGAERFYRGGTCRRARQGSGCDEVRKPGEHAQKASFEIAVSISAVSSEMDEVSSKMGELGKGVSSARKTADVFSRELSGSANSATVVEELAGTSSTGATAMATSMRMVSLAQRARADVNDTLNGKYVDTSGMSAVQRTAIEMTISKKWLKGSVEREALLDMYGNLFAHIEKQMGDSA